MDRGTGTPASSPEDVLILLPVFDDWAALTLLLEELDAVLLRESLRARVLVVDDASPTPAPEFLVNWVPRALSSVTVLPLRRNLGHQRAIALGLAYAAEHVACRAVLVMDGDGEDAPEDVPRLVRALRDVGERRIVFAARARRSESLLFRVLYHGYRLLHLVLTGIPVRVGNFSIVPAPLLRRLVCVSDLWNHYAAAVFVSRIPYETIPVRRAKRLAGRSRMDFVALVTHGLSALSVHSAVIGTRLLIATGSLLLLSALLLAGQVALRLFDAARAPQWLPGATLVLLLFTTQVLVLSLFGAFIALQGRSGPSFLPVRDYPHFVEAPVVLFPKPDGGPG
jgi:glycosyltransferase involved in cell wall biosynthesis